jgi:uncharacterized protein YgiM (DUF1202 family)
MRAVRWRTLGPVAGLLLLSRIAAAEDAWVRGEATLDLRTGASNEHRIVGFARPGEGVTVLERSGEWAHVQTADGKQGWAPGGYLDTMPPPALRLSHLQSQVERLREELSAASAQAEALRQENSALASRDAEQLERLRSLAQENLDLKAGQRWPYLISGASILGVGMVTGFLLRGSGRARARIRV